MVKKIKYLSLALIALGLNTPIYADYPLFCVTVPNQQGGFSIGGDLLWLRPGTANLAYSIVTSPQSLTSIIANSFILNPGHHWTFDLMTAYRIPCTGNDITALWTHIGNISDSSSETHALPFRLFIEETNSSNVTFKYDALDLDFGQRVNFGDSFNFRIFAGVRGADLKITVDETTTDFTTIPGSTSSDTLNQSSEFKGIGPQVGLEGRYCIGYGFGIDASTTLSALVGRLDSRGIQTATPFSPTPPAPTSSESVSQDKKNHIVPAIDMNLGLDYTFSFNNCSHSSVTIQGGYKVIHYWGASDSVFDNASGDFLSGINSISNIDFDGPYLGIKVNI